MIMAIMKIKEDIRKVRRDGLEEGIRRGRLGFLAEQGVDVTDSEPQEMADSRFATLPEPDPTDPLSAFWHCHLPAGEQECRVTPQGIFELSTGKQIYAFVRVSDGMVVISPVGDTVQEKGSHLPDA